MTLLSHYFTKQNQQGEEKQKILPARLSSYWLFDWGYWIDQLHSIYLVLLYAMFFFCKTLIRPNAYNSQMLWHNSPTMSIAIRFLITPNGSWLNQWAIQLCTTEYRWIYAEICDWALNISKLDWTFPNYTEHFQIGLNIYELQYKSVIVCFFIFWKIAQVFSRIASQKKHNAAAVALLLHGNLSLKLWRIIWTLFFKYK